MRGTLLGREQELDALEAFLERGLTGRAVLVLAGEPGIGKTVLWQAAVEHATPRYERVLVTRAVEAEASLAFAGLSDLLAEHLDHARSAISGQRRLALDVALLAAEPGAAPADPRAVGTAFLDVLRSFSSERPALLAVDDVQWLDPSSANVLRFALRRLRGEPVAVLMTVRKGAGARELLETEESERLDVSSLRLGPLHNIVRERVGIELSRPALARLYETTGGNPFFAIELARALKTMGATLDPGKPLPVPDDLEKLISRRLAGIPARFRGVLTSAAALARPTAEMLVTAHGPRALEALERASREGVVQLDENRVRFTHPLLAAVCYQHATPWNRRSAHQLLATVVPDAEERARHLALAATGPSDVVASALAAAGELAAGRGATSGAAELLELAAQLTPLGNAADRRRRVLRAADFHCLSGDRRRAHELPAQLLESTPAGNERARVLFKMASARQDELPQIVELCTRALCEAGGDAELAAEILVFQSWVELERDLPRALADARAALGYAERVGNAALVAAAVARVAIAELITGSITPGLLERGLAAEEQAAGLIEFHQSPHAVLARYLLRSGHLDQARAILERAEDAAALRGDEGTRGHILWILIMVEWLAGRWERALEHAGVAIELGEQVSDQQYHASVLNATAIVLAYRGDVDLARQQAERALEVAMTVADEAFIVWSLGVLGHIELAAGHVTAALQQLTGLPERLHTLGWKDPMVPLWSDAFEAQLLAGNLEWVRAHVVDYEHRARRLGRPWSLEVAGRCRGLLAAAEGDLPAALQILEGTIAELPDLPFPFERARTLLAVGSVHRRARQKRAARTALEQALAAFEALGAAMWATRARDEISRISGRRASDELTETERRIGSLAALGLPNKQIAAELSITVHTVEAHLTRVYRKLGVHSRAELAARLTTPANGPAKV